MGTLPANLNIPNCLNVNFNKPQGKMKIAVLCLVMVLLVVIKAASMKEDQEMNIDGDELQEMNIEKRADVGDFTTKREDFPGEKNVRDVERNEWLCKHNCLVTCKRSCLLAC